jgi:hypothetical protein
MLKDGSQGGKQCCLGHLEYLFKLNAVVVSKCPCSELDSFKSRKK